MSCVAFRKWWFSKRIQKKQPQQTTETSQSAPPVRRFHFLFGCEKHRSAWQVGDRTWHIFFSNKKSWASAGDVGHFDAPGGCCKKHRVEFVRFTTLIYVLGRNDGFFSEMIAILKGKTRPFSQQSDEKWGIFIGSGIFACVFAFLIELPKLKKTPTTSPSGNAANHWVSGMISNCPGLWMRHPKLGTNKKRPIFEKVEKNIHDLEFHGFNFRGCVYGDWGLIIHIYIYIH